MKKVTACCSLLNSCILSNMYIMTLGHFNNLVKFFWTLSFFLFTLVPFFLPGEQGGKGGGGGPDHESRAYFRSNHESRTFFETFHESRI